MSSWAQSSGLERRSLEGTLAFKGTEVSLCGPNDDSEALGQPLTVGGYPCSLIWLEWR